MNHSAAVRLSESHDPRSLFRLVRIALGRQVWLLPLFGALIGLLTLLTWDTPRVALAAFPAGVVAGIVIMLWFVDRYMRGQRGLVDQRLGDPLRSYTVTDTGITMRLQASAGQAPHAEPGGGQETGDLYVYTLAWPLVDATVREADGWYLKLVGNGEIFVPAAAVSGEVDAFIREKVGAGSAAVLDAASDSAPVNRAKRR